MAKFGTDILLAAFLDEFECGSPWSTFWHTDCMSARYTVSLKASLYNGSSYCGKIWYRDSSGWLLGSEDFKSGSRLTIFKETSVGGSVQAAVVYLLQRFQSYLACTYLGWSWCAVQSIDLFAQVPTKWQPILIKKITVLHFSPNLIFLSQQNVLGTLLGVRTKEHLDFKWTWPWGPF